MLAIAKSESLIWYMATTPDSQSRQRAHAERMLARAERRSRQALKLVEKWKTKLSDLDRKGIAAKQAKLWSDDQPEQGSGPNS
jgi:hypothetical protein